MVSVCDCRVRIIKPSLITNSRRGTRGIRDDGLGCETQGLWPLSLSHMICCCLCTAADDATDIPLLAGPH